MRSVLTWLLQHLRHAWPDTLLVFRGDSHFASPEVMQWIEAPTHLHAVTGWTSNAVLTKWAHEVVEQANRVYERDGGKVTRAKFLTLVSGCWRFPLAVQVKVATPR